MHVGLTPLNDVSFRVFDIEATGLDPIHDDIIDIAVYEVRQGRIEKRFESLIKPRVAINEHIVALTGIQPDQPQTPLEHLFPQIADALSGHCLVAHNAHADVGYLTQALWRCDPHWTLPPVACTLKLSRQLLPDLPGHSLAALAEQLHLTLPTHRAAPDAKATAELLLLLLDKAKDAHTLDDFLALSQRKRKARPEPRISPLTVLALPQTAGIYRFFADDERLLYVGYSSDVQRRVREHLFQAHSGQSLEIAKRAVRIEVTTHASPLDAFIAEGMAIVQENPLLNVRNAEHGRLRYFKLTDTGGITLVPYPAQVGPIVLKRAERDVLKVVRQAFGLSARGTQPNHPGVQAFLDFTRGQAVDTQPLSDPEWQLLLDIRRACRQAESARLDERAPFKRPTFVRHVAAPHIIYALALGRATLRLEEQPITDWPLHDDSSLDDLGKRVAAFVRAHPLEVQLSDAHIDPGQELRAHHV